MSVCRVVEFNEDRTQVIVTSESLTEFLAPMRQTGRIALDTEADSLHCYFEKLCLVQISIPGHDVLIDPLAGISLQPLFDELRGHEIILQGLDYDLRLLRRVGLEEVGGVFDTMIAARLVGHMEFSLAALLEKYFGVTLAKGSQKANWAKRPLSPRMEEYARNDTRHLLPLAEKLEEELHRLGRWEWFTQTCEKAVAATRVSRERDLQNVWRVAGSGELRGHAAAIFRGLWFWRDEEARAVDRPAFHIARNEVLIDAARTFAGGGRVEIAHLPAGRKKRFNEAVEKLLVLPESEWPRPIRGLRTRPTAEQEKAFTALKERRDRSAQAHQIEASFIAPKSMLESIAFGHEGAMERLLPWQKMLLGLEE